MMTTRLPLRVRRRGHRSTWEEARAEVQLVLVLLFFQIGITFFLKEHTHILVIIRFDWSLAASLSQK
jgi:hypothetical protein